VLWSNIKSCDQGLYYQRELRSAKWYGGGIVFYSNASPIISNCIILDNDAYHGGGIASLNSGATTLNNCLITGNSADWGGGIKCDTYNLTINSCTLSANTSSNGAGIWISGNQAITNSIFWDNDPQEIVVLSGTPTLNYCDVEGGWSGAGTGNTNSDPLFTSGALHNYYLSQIAAGQVADSPCINAGSDSAQNIGLDKLFTRTDNIPDSGIVDMGYHSYVLKIDSISNNLGNITIHWNGILTTGMNYIVQWSTDFKKWRNIPIGGTDTWVDIFISSTKKFYRVMEE